MKHLTLGRSVATMLLAFSMTAIADNNSAKPPAGSSKLFAKVPFPGYPEGIVVNDGKVYVSGPAAFGVPGNAQPSTVLVYERSTGVLLRTITIQNQPGPMKAISCIAIADDSLYVADETQGIVKINLENGHQSVYSAPFYPVFQSAYNPPAPVLL
ncbi:MAG: hypothetical protein NTY38_33995, partial [Acidobacteria bacterium]|nr:hypothetical protein [Acidobacteriota bacterium]